jgi:hypothetical protein
VFKSYNIGLCANVLCKRQQAAPLRTSQFADVLSAQALEANVIIIPATANLFHRFGISCPRMLTADWLISIPTDHRMQPQVRVAASQQVSVAVVQTHARAYAAWSPGPGCDLLAACALNNAMKRLPARNITVLQIY